MSEKVFQLPTPAKVARRIEDIIGVERKEAPWSAIVTFTPEQAREVLAAQPPTQRRIARPHVKELADDLEAGDWDLTNEGVGFDEDGLLTDGQHRFEGCVASGRPLTILVLFNMKRAAFRSVNRGKRRSPADDLAALGLTVGDARFGATLAAAARVVLAHERGLLPNLSDPRLRMRPADLAGVLDRHPLLDDSTHLVLSKRHASLRMPAAPMAGLLTLFREVDDAAAVAFADQIMTGEYIGRGDPAFALRKAQENDHSTQNASRTAFMFRFVRAWEALRKGRRVELVKGRVGTAAFPEVHGYRSVAQRMAG